MRGPVEKDWASKCQPAKGCASQGKICKPHSHPCMFGPIKHSQRLLESALNPIWLQSYSD